MAKRSTRRKTRKSQKLKSNWKSVFLRTLAETSNVSKAADAAGAKPFYVYRVRRADAEFRQQWSAALLEGYEHLEMETLERLRFGIGAGDTKVDIPNALRLLTAHREAAAKEKARRDKRDEASVLASLNAKIDRMRERKAAMEKMVVARASIIGDDPDGCG